MNREIHVRFWESLGVRFSRATHLPHSHCFGFGEENNSCSSGTKFWTVW